MGLPPHCRSLWDCLVNDAPYPECYPATEPNLFFPFRVAILFAFAIYIRAGRVIYKRRDQLKGFLNPMNENPFTGVVTTEIDVTVGPAQSPSQISTKHGNVFDKDFDRIPGMEEGQFDPYTVNIGVGENEHNKKPSKPELFRMKSITREEALKETTNPGAWLYARVAFLFFLSMLIIWVRVSPLPPTPEHTALHLAVLD